MKNTFSKTFSTITAVVLLLITSCRNDDEQMQPQPNIIALEVGLGNSHTSYIGSDIHIEAEIEASGKINTVEVEVFKKDGAGWQTKKVYSEFSGQLNTTFHKHIDVAPDAAPGNYVLRMKVTDMLGQSRTVDEDLELIILQDSVSPIINITTFPAANKLFLNGETITISGTVSDNIALGNVLVALVREEDLIPDGNLSDTHSQIITMLDLRDFASTEIQDFTASINVGATSDYGFPPKPIQGANAWKSGSYYIVVKTKDASQNVTFSQHYPIKINL
ncbi:protein of unknown function [Chryseobacterium soldanellicola]|uniref:DUF4625 domain-containing protein n=1 Tax=Chryseobacterium soldanellicola TaxID=311333 RepID=A0A1H1FIL4_9FLAO|nr:DUF4625 domain-containing protein [Chryseobacterium soldanellicola]SDR00684.1 protein of unknown function [Chryseobacterium soldanellicola]